MNKEIKQIIESLQFLLSMQHPKSERYRSLHTDIMTKNYLLLHLIKKSTIPERTNDSLSEGKVFIERASPLTKEGIRAVCGTEEEYKKYTEDLKSESSEAKNDG